MRLDTAGEFRKGGTKLGFFLGEESFAASLLSAAKLNDN